MLYFFFSFRFFHGLGFGTVLMRVVNVAAISLSALGSVYHPIRRHRRAVTGRAIAKFVRWEEGSGVSKTLAD